MVYAGGLGDLQVNLKWQAFALGPWSFGLKPSYTLPTGKEGVGTGPAKSQLDAVLLNSLDLGAFSLHLNVGWADVLTKGDGLRNETWRSSLAVAAGLPADLTLALEAGLGQEEELDQVSTPAFGTLGLIWSINDSADLDLGYQHAVLGSSSSRTFLAGLTLRR